ncbi:PIN-like domain-containing protein [Streptomyces sp. JH14]|uniref:PIN-like domain-containing protein n=1 Tax=Streptomyces sp. JH14 TaxID=2793630 RepID=UPI0023F87878|nr:PIN-like domain-containing protein [Streptomyces sp. JH14]MDF6042116.1 PIN-like domain-containing protein [Streptomyces sp. JH14]
MEHDETPQTSDTDGAGHRGIFDGFSGFVTPTVEDWKTVLRSGLVVVDTNVLLNLYRYNQDARASLLAALQNLGSCLWVPHQVMSEFWSGREGAIDDPRKQLEDSEIALKKGLQSSLEGLRRWANRVSLDRSQVMQLETKLTTACDEVLAKMVGVVDIGEQEMAKDTSKDKVVASLATLLDGKIGAALEAKILAEAVAEGKRRVHEKIPPGYMDKSKTTRGDDSEAGDYLVWLQLILEAKKRGTDVLLVTGDIKEDWWRTRNKIPLGPRNELAEELLREAGVRLYMLRPEGLLSYARDFLEVEVTEDSLQNVEMVDAQSTRDSVFRDLVDLMEVDPSGAALGAWREVEGAVERAFPDYVKGGPRFSPFRRVRHLGNYSGVSSDVVRAIRELQEIRNNLVHASGFEFTEEGIRTFLERAKGIVDALALAGAPGFQAVRFEQAVLEAIRGMGFDAAIPTGGGREFDIAVREGENSDSYVYVQVKYLSDGEFSARRLREQVGLLASASADVASVIVVTNADLSNRAREFNSTIDSSSGIDGRRLEIVQWNGSEDDPLLMRALGRAMRKAGPSESE